MRAQQRPPQRPRQRAIPMALLLQRKQRREGITATTLLPGGVERDAAVLEKTTMQRDFVNPGDGSGTEIEFVVDATTGQVRAYLP